MHATSLSWNSCYCWTSHCIHPILSTSNNPRRTRDYLQHMPAAVLAWARRCAGPAEPLRAPPIAPRIWYPLGLNPNAAVPPSGAAHRSCRHCVHSSFSVVSIADRRRQFVNFVRAGTHRLSGYERPARPLMQINMVDREAQLWKSRLRMNPVWNTVPPLHKSAACSSEDVKHYPF